jgi:DNA-binding ferritin-like protein
VRKTNAEGDLAMSNLLITVAQDLEKQHWTFEAQC